MRRNWAYQTTNSNKIEFIICEHRICRLRDDLTTNIKPQQPENNCPARLRKGVALHQQQHHHHHHRTTKNFETNLSTVTKNHFSFGFILSDIAIKFDRTTPCSPLIFFMSKIFLIRRSSNLVWLHLICCGSILGFTSFISITKVGHNRINIVRKLLTLLSWAQILPLTLARLPLSYMVCCIRDHDYSNQCNHSWPA